MALALIPDAEAVVARHLGTHPAVVALGAFVRAGVPDRTDRPWLQVRQLDGRDRSRLPDREYWVDFMLQIDCYAGRLAHDARTAQRTASTMSRTVRAILTEMVGVFDGVTVGGGTVTSDPRLPDAAFEPAMERRVLTVTIRMHPAS